MIYSQEVEAMCPVKQGVAHGCAPIPEEAKWVKAKQITDISGFTHGVGWCAPQQGACKLTLNVKEGIVQEALVETLGCSGMTHSAAYATAHIGTVQVGSKTLSGFHTDMVTVNPYLGTDGVKPFVDVCKKEDKGIFVLVKTSNPSSGEFQDQLIDGRPLYELVADKVMEWGQDTMDGDFSNVGAVVGATYPEMSRILRKLMPKTFFLVPGYGAQGATAEDLRPCFTEDGRGAIVNSSRGIIAAYKKAPYDKFGPEHFGEASRQAVMDMVADINRVL